MKFVRSLIASTLFALCLVIGYAPSSYAQAFAGSCAQIRGSFTGTLTGYASPPTGTVQFRIDSACRVTLWLTAAISGTSNAATMTMTGLPYNLAPNAAVVGSQVFPTIVTDNTANTTGCFQISAPATPPAVITFSNTGACAGAMTNTGTKGLLAGWTATYVLY
jgi:hypothetical protein